MRLTLRYWHMWRARGSATDVSLWACAACGFPQVFLSSRFRGVSVIAADNAASHAVALRLGAKVESRIDFRGGQTTV